jgi:hypothetical protein
MFTIYTFPEHKRNIKKPKLKQSSWVAGHRAWDPPDPIPNSEVKPRSVSGASMVFGHVKPEKLAIHLNTKNKQHHHHIFVSAGLGQNTLTNLLSHLIRRN